MTKKLILLVIIMASVILIAERPEISIWNNIRNSAYTIDNQLYIRTEIVDLPVVNTYLYHFNNDIWQEQEMTNLNVLTIEGIIGADSDITQYCRFKTVLDTLVAMMPAFIQADGFPPLLDQMSFIHNDPVGDSLLSYNENLDITSSYFGYSDTRFYSAMQNLTGQYPTNSGGFPPSEFYFYVHGIINPENVLEDSVAYGMVYASIPFLFSPGLYKISGIEFSLDSIEFLDDIEVEEVDGTLILACDLESITTDDDFGDWPSMSNSLGVDVITGTYVFPADFSLNDLSMPSLQFIDQYIVDPFENQLPQITNIEYSIGDQITEITLDYYDEDGNFPLISEIITDLGTYDLFPQSFDFTESVVFQGEIIETEWDEFLLRVSDNGYEFTEELIYNTQSDNNIVTLPINIYNSPNPFNPETRINYYLGSETMVSIKIYNVKGQLIESLINSVQSSGNYSYILNMKGQPSGTYLYRLMTEDQIMTRKMILTK